MSKYIAAIAIALSLASTAFAKGAKVQYDVCCIENGKVSVYEVTPTVREALTLAKYAEKHTHKHHFVIVEELDAKGDVK